MNLLFRNLNDNEFIKLFEVKTDAEKLLLDRIVSINKKNEELCENILGIETEKNNLESEIETLKEEIEEQKRKIARLTEIIAEEV